MQAGELIDDARGYHPKFHRRFSGEKGPLRQLSSIEQATASELAQEHPEAISVTGTVAGATIATALAGTGVVAVPEYITILDPMWAILVAGGQYRCRQMPRATQYQGGAPFPSVALAHAALELTDLRRVTGGTEHGWEEIDSIRYQYVPLPADLTSETSELTLPRGLRGYLTACLAQWMATRLELGTAALEKEKATSMAAFLSVELQGRGTTWHVLDEVR